MIYAVIDTNVWVSAFLTKNRDAATFKTFEHLTCGDIVPLYNKDIMTEYLEVLQRKKFKFSEASIKNLFEYIKKYGIDTERTPFLGSMPDEDDRVFYEVSLSKEDSFMVTGNLKHYPVEPRVVTPAEFLKIVESSRDEEWV